MAISLSSNFNSFVQGFFETDSYRYIRNANCFILSGSTVVTGSSVSLCVKDKQNVQQYLLTDVSNPPIQLETPSNLYFVDSIDVTNFPEGKIDLIWTLTYQSLDYVLTSSVDYTPSVPAIFTSNQTSTIQDFSITLDSAKTFSIKIVDSMDNAVDGQGAQLVVYDSFNNSNILTVSGTLASSGSGFYSATTTISNTTCSPSINRFEAFWQVSLNGSWFEVANSRQFLQIFGTNGNVRCGNLTYSTNQDLRTFITGIDLIINSQHRQRGEIEIILNAKRQMASSIIRQAINQNPALLSNHDLLRNWEMYLVYKMVLLDSGLETKNEILIKQIEKEICQIKLALFGSIGSLRIIN